MPDRIARIGQEFLEGVILMLLAKERKSTNDKYEAMNIRKAILRRITLPIFALVVGGPMLIWLICYSGYLRIVDLLEERRYKKKWAK